ncbi:2-C-methyl-D-erythritol 4-phosphate cytidylyltransferase [Deminuibacter soli]|uniref:2-C-methyl-D-erythritol 4-phosphate cytidylyltransferase n=1 Tax=Deminuibacter soli TaxID=2291815 RepID=A0A3E1NMI5_9BACT|nr:2-C-methyl-D-erythritol 4-phosphate cytidylyltransferase [Deminuibacter soli]RFM29122.1 2-C-methyl-D-erythritol 4-phosphate cytidylyltransferase [Deminuibacter soli]
MKKYAVIVAGGSGTRMASAVPKQFLLLQQQPVLWHTLQAFLEAFEDIHIIVVLPAMHLEAGQAIAQSLSDSARITLTEGGATRFHSVQKGLQLVKEEAVIFVHDGVRCLVSPRLIRQCYTQALEQGSAIPAVAATDSIRIVSTNQTHQVADRNLVRIIQTPQTFHSAILLPAFEQAYSDAFTDEATVVEATGQTVYLIEGEYNNIKITRPADLLLAEQLLAERNR